MVTEKVCFEPPGLSLPDSRVKSACTSHLRPEIEGSDEENRPICTSLEPTTHFGKLPQFRKRTNERSFIAGQKHTRVLAGSLAQVLEPRVPDFVLCV